MMPYSELYNWDSCAQFVADFLSMVPLSDPLKPVGATLGCILRSMWPRMGSQADVENKAQYGSGHSP